MPAVCFIPEVDDFGGLVSQVQVALHAGMGCLVILRKNGNGMKICHWFSAAAVI